MSSTTLLMRSRGRRRELCWGFVCLLIGSFSLGAQGGCGEPASHLGDASAGEPEARVDGGAQPVDASADAGPADAGPTLDAGAADAGPTLDAGAADAGPTLDAGAADAGPTLDAGALACDWVHQTGCAQGEKCDLDRNGKFACVPDGTLGDFRRCEPSLPNACAAGLSCRQSYRFSGSVADYRCAQLCLPTEDQCRADEPCKTANTTHDGQPYGMCATNQECNPILDDCIDSSMHCTWFIRSMCLLAGQMLDGATCQKPQDCGPGSACLKAGIGSAYKCFRLCAPGGMPACPASLLCTPFTSVGPLELGACGL